MGGGFTVQQVQVIDYSGRANLPNNDLVKG